MGYVSLVESSITKLVTLSLLNIIKNLGLPPNEILEGKLQLFEISVLLAIGKEDDAKLSYTCASLTMLTTLSYISPTRPDLMLFTLT